MVDFNTETTIDGERISVDVDVQFWCAICGKGICNNATPNNKGGFYIEPCKHCMDGEKEDAYKDGYAAGKDEGQSVGYDEGYAAAEIKDNE